MKNFPDVFSGKIVSPEAILDGRESRVEWQNNVLAGGCESLITFTLNIPGAVKRFPLSDSAFHVGLEELRACFSSDITGEYSRTADTGSEALLSLRCPARTAKLRTVAIEEAHPLGRLFDMDVQDGHGFPLSRSELGISPRECMLCGQNAKVCGRSRAHSLDALRLCIAEKLDSYFKDCSADECSSLLTRALLYEVSVSPKPGLVDQINSGSHTDMDFFTFLDSSAALSPHFRRMFHIGWDGADLPERELFSQLRYAGSRAENCMLRATGGVNTHKGLVFSFGILCGAFGAAHPTVSHPAVLGDVLDRCSRFGRLAMEDFFLASASTAGRECYSRYRITGIRGEAARGFPSAVKIGLPHLESLTNRGLALNVSAAITLVALMANVDDTNMIHRGGIALAKKYKQLSADLLPALNGDSYFDVLTEFDRQMRTDHLSPGGCADILALSLALFFLKQSRLILTDTVS